MRKLACPLTRSGCDDGPVVPATHDPLPCCSVRGACCYHAAGSLAHRNKPGAAARDALHNMNCRCTRENTCRGAHKPRTHEAHALHRPGQRERRDMANKITVESPPDDGGGGGGGGGFEGGGRGWVGPVPWRGHT